MKKQRQRGEAVSLFPFLSILACVIGVLTLTITALALGQIEEEKPNAEMHERSQQYKALQKQVAADEEQWSGLVATISRGEQVREKLDRARNKLEKLQAEQLDAALVEQSAARLQAEAAALAAQIEATESAITGTTQTIAQLREELARRLAPPEDAQVVLEGGQHRPGGDFAALSFTFVECRSEGVVIHGRGKQQAVPREVLGEPSLPYFQTVERVAAAQPEGGCLLFLVRSDAFDTFAAALQIARSRRCLTGKLPVPGQGDIDLSVFSDAL